MLISGLDSAGLAKTNVPEYYPYVRAYLTRFGARILAPTSRKIGLMFSYLVVQYSDEVMVAEFRQVCGGTVAAARAVNWQPFLFCGQWARAGITSPARAGVLAAVQENFNGA
jgi:hypothetical protein